MQLVRDTVAIPTELAGDNRHFWFDFVFGIFIAAATLAVIIGRIQRVGYWALRLVPTMVLLYTAMVSCVLIEYFSEIPAALKLIFADAFSGGAIAGGAVGTVLLTGVRRGAFSNEAGIGTESMAHGAARTNEPIREGLVAMMGPVIDTLVVCTCTALVILLTGTWQQSDDNGVSVTANAFESVMPSVGGYLLLFMVLLLSFSIMISFWYYGSKCLGFLVGAERQYYYIPIYIGLVSLGESGHYGNALLLKQDVTSVNRIDISMAGREPRGVIEAGFNWHNLNIRVLATHLGLNPKERRCQVRERLLPLLKQMSGSDCTVLMGDLNEWLLWGRPLRWLKKHFIETSAHPTFPAAFPVFALDRIWVCPHYRLSKSETLRNQLTKVASDHLPLRAFIRCS